MQAQSSEKAPPNQQTQSRPDARYPNPSGQDSAPKQTTVKPTQTAPPSANPEDPSTSTKGKSAENTYQTGKKADASAGCSTPTDARSAGVDPSSAQGQRREDGKKTVCTTAGADGVGATDKSGKAKEQKSATAPREPAPKPR